MKQIPDFYLCAAKENEELAVPRACWIRSRLRDEVRDDRMLVEISPPLIGQKYGLGDKNLDNLILSPRFEGSSLFPIEEWPCHVYVARMIDESIMKEQIVSVLKQLEGGTSLRDLGQPVAIVVGVTQAR